MSFHHLLTWIILMRNLLPFSPLFPPHVMCLFFLWLILRLSSWSLVLDNSFLMCLVSFLPISCVQGWFTFSKQTLLGNVLSSVLSLLRDIPVIHELGCLRAPGSLMLFWCFKFLFLWPLSFIWDCFYGPVFSFIALFFCHIQNAVNLI